MANLRTSTDILKDILFNLGEPQDNSSDFYNQAIITMNRTYQSLCIGGKEIDPDIDEVWWWLRKSTPGVITLLPSISAGTVAVTNGSANITFTSVPKDCFGNNVTLQALANSHGSWKFIVPGDNGDIFNITSHTAGQLTGTLDQVFTGTTNVAASYKCFLLQYALATDCNEIVGNIRGFQDDRFETTGSDPSRIAARYPRNQMWVGLPKEFAYIAEQMVEFSHYPGDQATNVCRLEYDYTVLPSDLVDDGGSTSPLTPSQYNHIISDWASSLLLLNKDDQKATFYSVMAKTGLQAMYKDQRRKQLKSSNETGQIYTRLRDRHRFDGPIRTQSGLIIG